MQFEYCKLLRFRTYMLVSAHTTEKHFLEIEKACSILLNRQTSASTSENTDPKI